MITERGAMSVPSARRGFFPHYAAEETRFCTISGRNKLDHGWNGFNKLPFQTEWQQRARSSSFEEPACTDAETMLPGWQSRGVKRETCLARECAAECFAASEHGRAFSAETDCFAEFFEMFGMEFFAVEKSFDVAGRETRFLKRELGSAGERRRRIGIDGDVAEREHVVVLRELQRGLDDQQSAFRLFGIELFDYGIHAHAAEPHHGRGFDLLFVAVVLKRDVVFRDVNDARQRVHFNARLAQRVLDVLANLISHAGHDSVAHFEQQHARFAVQRAPLERVGQQVGHFGREFAAAGAGADEGKRQLGAHVLRRHVGWNAIERRDHAAAQVIGVFDLAKGKGKLVGAGDTGVVCDAADREHQNVVRQRFRLILEADRLGVQVDAGCFRDEGVDVSLDQFIVARGDMPGLDLAAEVLVKHRREDEMVFVGDERHVVGAAEFEGRKQASEAPADNHDSGFWHMGMVIRATKRHKPQKHLRNGWVLWFLAACVTLRSLFKLSGYRVLAEFTAVEEDHLSKWR